MPVFVVCMYVFIYFEFQEPLHPEDEISPQPHVLQLIFNVWHCFGMLYKLRMWDIA